MRICGKFSDHTPYYPLNPIKIHEDFQGDTDLDKNSDPEELKAFLKHVLPDYDEDRVYVSDIKKVFQWYNHLQKHNLLEVIDKEEESEESDENSENAEETSETSDEKSSEGSSESKE